MNPRTDVVTEHHPERYVTATIVVGRPAPDIRVRLVPWHPRPSDVCTDGSNP